jgi:NSS family neurotransmitter:Na+ symporter
MTSPNGSVQRDSWGSRGGFVLAAVGSAIGLGNIWRFPYVVGEGGGAAFVLIYLGFVFLIGAAVMLAELALGRHTHRNPVGAFEAAAPGTLWKLVGLIGVITGVAILSFYGVIAGWTVGYFFKTITGSFSQAITAEESQAIFGGLVGSPVGSLGLLFAFLGITALVVWRGVSGGIERVSKILMPILFGLLILLAIRSVTLSGAGAGLEFYLAPDFSRISAQTFPAALGQAFFSLSLGMGAMITYGSYVSKDINLGTSAGIICFFDTLVALLAGLIIFPALFHAGLSPSSGVGLVFQVLPTLFAELPAGQLFGAAFFLLLAIAALTSTISLLEVPVSYVIDEWGWPRGKAVAAIGLVTFLIGVPSALASGAVAFFSDLPGAAPDFLTLMSIIFGNYSLTIGSLGLAIFVGYRWGVRAAAAEIESEGVRFDLLRLWTFLIRFLAPVGIVAILVYIIATGNYF